MKKTMGIALALMLAMAGYGFGKGIAETDSFVLINGGTFTMGSPEDEGGRDDNEVQHQVTVGSFYMGKYEVTQKEWYDVMGTTVQQQRDKAGDSTLYGEGDNYPMYNVSWYDAIEYCNARSRKEGLTPAYTIDKNQKDPNNKNSFDDVKWVITWNRNANGYRLPTEAEWEYACRAGTTTAYHTGASITNITDWYVDDYTTRPAGQNPANAWGLYDMHGNVSEWCWDWYDDYPSGTQTNPVGASSGSDRVERGGGWSGADRDARSANRSGVNPASRFHSQGFRVARNAP